MSQAPEPTQTLVPPRPNPGPEPWRGDPGVINPWLVLTIACALAAVLAIGIRRRRRTSRAGRAPGTSIPFQPPDDAPEARLLALCEQVRGSLSSRFGPGLRARTTEEIIADPRIRELLGIDHFDRLTELLQAGDRLKFAGNGAVERIDERIGELAAWAAAIERLPHPPGEVNARSRRSPGERTERRSPRNAPRPS